MPRPATAEQVVAAVRGLAAEPRSGTVWIGIDGRGACGKTTLAGRIAAAVPGVDVVHVDDFWGPSITTWDVARFRREVVEPLRAARPARYRIWDWDRDRPGGWAQVPPGRLLVVEGVSATTAAVDVPWALRVWVDAPREVRLARALARDGVARLPRWQDEWMPSEERYVAAERPDERADLTVDGTVDGTVRTPPR